MALSVAARRVLGAPYLFDCCAGLSQFIVNSLVAIVITLTCRCGRYIEFLRQSSFVAVLSTFIFRHEHSCVTTYLLASCMHVASCSISVRQWVQSLDCLAAAGLFRYRGSRGGTNARRSRAFVYKHNPLLHLGRFAQCAYDRRDRSVDDQPRHRVLVPVSRVAEEQSVKVGVHNVRSLGNKSATVHDIVDNSLDLSVVVESWHYSV